MTKKKGPFIIISKLKLKEEKPIGLDKRPFKVTVDRNLREFKKFLLVMNWNGESTEKFRVSRFRSLQLTPKFVKFQIIIFIQRRKVKSKVKILNMKE